MRLEITSQLKAIKGITTEGQGEERLVDIFRLNDVMLLPPSAPKLYLCVALHKKAHDAAVCAKCDGNRRCTIECQLRSKTYTSHPEYQSFVPNGK